MTWNLRCTSSDSYAKPTFHGDTEFEDLKQEETWSPEEPRFESSLPTLGIDGEILPSTPHDEYPLAMRS